MRGSLTKEGERSIMIVAVDGPSGAGKSSVCRTVAERVHFMLVDTGALYRCVGWKAIGEGISLDAAETLGDLARGLDISFHRAGPGKEQQVWCDGVDVTEKIRTAEIGQAASVVSAHPPVRAALLEQQRALGRASGGAIVEGRDIGTVVFPDAELKVFYTATVEARTDRRYLELKNRGRAVELDFVHRELLERDRRDSTRAVAPLRKPEDAVELDTSSLTFEEACAALIALIEERRAELA